MLKLKQITKKDKIEIYKMTQDKLLMQFIANKKIWSMDKVNKFLKYNVNTPKSYKIMLDEDIIGLIWIKNINREKTIFIKRSFQSKGYGKKTIILFNKLLVNNNIYYYFEYIDKNNIPSLKIAYNKYNTIKIKEKTKFKDSYKFIQILKFDYNEPKLENINKFIYFNKVININNLIKLFNLLKNYKVKKFKKNIQLEKNILENDYIIKKNYYADYYINKITDYFTEKDKLYYKFNNKRNIDIFNIKNIYNKYSFINNYLMYKYLSENNYNIYDTMNSTTTLILFKIFKPTNVLDLSIGWGDKLIAAIAYGVKYTGCNPIKSIKDKYNNIINTLAINKDMYKVKDTNIKLNNKFDLIIFSPSFLDLYVYDIKYMNNWKESFLFPNLIKYSDYIIKGGHIIIYIGDNDIKDILEFIKKNKLYEYNGNINMYNEITDKINIIYVFTKI
jgi:hypothetical protein